MRNEFNHCMYVLDERGEFTHTNRMQEVKGRLQPGFAAEQGYLGLHGRPAEVPRHRAPTRDRAVPKS